MVRACRWQRLRRKLIAATDAKAAGIWGGMLCRKRYADDQVSAAVAAGIDQIVVLGAGMDTRGYRLGGSARVFEVDLPANIDTKRSRVRAALGTVPDHVRLVPVDLETDDLAEALTAAGFEIGRPVMIVWEAVTQYLTEDAVRHTLTWSRKPPPAADWSSPTCAATSSTAPTTYQAEGAYRDFVQRHRVWHFGLTPDQVAPLLADYGWTEDEQVGTAEYQRRYVEPTGRQFRSRRSNGSSPPPSSNPTQPSQRVLASSQISEISEISKL